MAGNVREWTTETYSQEVRPWVVRGGDYDDTRTYTAYRYAYGWLDPRYAYDFVGFRPLLYL